MKTKAKKKRLEARQNAYELQHAKQCLMRPGSYTRPGSMNK